MPINYELKEIERDHERDIVLGLIISTQFAKRVRTIYNSNYFNLYYAKTVSSWCIEYYDKYKKAPFTDIQSLYEAKKDNLPEDKAQLIDAFLSSISGQFEEDSKYNIDYHIDEAKKYFKGRSLLLLEEKMRGLRILGDYDGAEAELAKYKRVEEGSCEGKEVWDKDEESIIELIRNLESNDNALLTFPRTLGKFIRPFRRGDFVALFGPSSRGKSWWLIEWALWASFNRLNVLFFSFEMLEEQVLARIYQRITGKIEPMSGDSYKDKEEVTIPFFDHNYDINQQIHQRKEIRYTIQPMDVIQKIRDIHGTIKNSKFRIVSEPAGSMSIADVNNHLDNLEYYENFVPDVVLVDYADITKPEKSKEKRHQLDEIWQGYRAIAHKRRILVATVSHTVANTFDRDIKTGDAAENKRKIDHLTWCGGLNQTDEENDQGVMRMNILKDRFKRTQKTKEAVILQNLDCGQVYLDCRIKNRKEKE